MSTFFSSSQTVYVDSSFPAVFSGTADTPYSKLRSIDFPSNVTSIATSAFEWCSGLESVNLWGIKTINTKAFYRSGLVKLTVPSTVTSMPGYLTFGCCPRLTEVLYDTPAPQVGGNGSSGTNHAHFAWATMTGEKINPVEVTDTYNSADYPLTFTFGNNSAKAIRYMFKYNRKLVKATFESAFYFSNYVFDKAYSLHTIDCSALLTPPGGNSYVGSGFGKDVPDGTAKQIIVPAEAMSTYAATVPWSSYVSNGGYTIVAAEYKDLPADEGWITLAAGNATPYRIVASSANKTNLGLFAAQLEAKTGAKFLYNVANSDNAAVYEIIVGNLSSRPACSGLLTGIANGYVMKVVGRQIVLASTDDTWAAVAMEDFVKNVLTDSRYLAGGVLKLPLDFEMTRNEADPQFIASFLKSGRPFTLKLTSIGTVPVEDSYKVAQGVAFDGTNVYFVMRKSNDTGTKVHKYTLSPFEKVASTAEFAGHHSNDMTFDTKNNRALVCHGSGDPYGLTAVDAATMNTSYVTSPNQMGGLTYNAKNNIYGITQGGKVYKTLDENFNLISDFGRTDATGYTAQGMGSDDSYVYFPMSGSSDNILVVYDWDGNYAAKLTVSLDEEIESMFYGAGRYFVYFYIGSSTGGRLYELTPLITCDFE